jgi:hypothetical protein
MGEFCVPPSAPPTPATPPSGILRAITRKAKGSLSDRPRRFTVSTSTSAPESNRFASLWEEASGPALAIAATLQKPGRPIGLIYMDSAQEGKGKRDAILKEWIAAEHLNLALSLQDDFMQLASIRPGTEAFDANARNYTAAWKSYWNDYIPELMTTKRVPDGAAWGSYPKLTTAITTTASQVHNVLVESFTPASLSGIIFVSNASMCEGDEAQHFSEQMTALANSMKIKFGGDDVPFVFTMPAKSLAPKITAPSGIKGKSKAIELGNWNDGASLLKGIDEVF